MTVKVYRPGPLPWAKVPIIGYPSSFGMPFKGWDCLKVDYGVIDVAGHVCAGGGLPNPHDGDTMDIDAYHMEYAARKAARGKPHLTCQWCTMDERKRLIRTANRKN